MRSIVTCGLSRAIAAAALSTLAVPISAVPMDHLPLQIRQRDSVVVDDAERADAGGGQIEQDRRAEPAGADHQHARAFQRRLAGAADLAQHDVAGVAFEFFGGQHRGRSGFGPHITRLRPRAGQERPCARTDCAVI